jgi:hypothetical protein
MDRTRVISPSPIRGRTGARLQTTGRASRPHRNEARSWFRTGTGSRSASAASSRPTRSRSIPGNTACIRRCFRPAGASGLGIIRHLIPADAHAAAALADHLYLRCQAGIQRPACLHRAGAGRHVDAATNSFHRIAVRGRAPEWRLHGARGNLRTLRYSATDCLTLELVQPLSQSKDG